MKVTGEMTMLKADRFVNLLDGHRKILYKVAGTYARDAADRQDLVQEMVVQLWRSSCCTSS
jgi:DNA-directed RNA polymerase specialized sigma24 family protein